MTTEIDEDASEHPVTAFPEQVPSGGEEIRFVDRRRMSVMGTLKEAAHWGPLKKSPYGIIPLLILVAIGTFQAFDAEAFVILRPEIIKDLDLKVTTFLNVLNFIGTILIFGVIGIAYYSDRRKRAPVVASFSVVAGISSLFTGFAKGIGSLGGSRVAGTIGKAVSSTPQQSLVADYYPPETRGKAFAAYGTLIQGAVLFSPFIVVAIAGGGKHWRTPFFVFAPVMIITGLIAVLKLREPVRGYMERKALGASDEVANSIDEPPSLGEAWRTIWAIRTLRRLFISNIFDAAGSLVFGTFWVLFLFERYAFSPLQRAEIGIFAGVFGLAGGFIGGGIVDSLMKHRPQRVLVFSGGLGVVASLAVAVLASGPPVWVLYIVFGVFGFFSALLGPASGVIYAQIVPANVRSLGFAVQGLAAIPAAILNGFAINILFTRYGFQGALFGTVPFLFIAGLIAMSAAGFFDRDMRSAFAVALASDEWRRAKQSGRGKLLVCRDIDVEYDGVQVLFGVDFDVDDGDIIALLGTNGAGKSTLLRAISGTQEASSGAVVFDGRDITHMPPHEIAGRNVIHMPGGRGVFPGLTVKDNLLLGGWVATEEQTKERLAEVFEIFPILKERSEETAGTLSGGEQQMVALAQAFLSRPRLLMIDELSLGLSPAVVQQLIEVVREIHKRGVTIIIVEQSVNIALTIADRAIFMEKGEVKFIGKTADLLTRPDILRAIYVKGSGALTDGAPANALKTERELRAYELGRARNILEVKGLSRSYGGIKALTDVSFELKEGESLGLIGPNGAGKTTLLDLISGYQIPDAGTVIFDGKDITNLRPDERSNLRLIRRFQDAKLFPSLTVFENLLMALDRKLDIRNMALTAMQVPQVRASERRIRLRAERLIDLLELGAFRDKFVKELSTGLRRIVDLACVLAAEPKVLLLDEPSSGIAQAEAEGLAPLLRRVRFETGCSMLVIEHDMPLISAISDELIALEQGRFLMRGTPTEVLDDERVIESYLGTSQEVVNRSGAIT